VSLFSVDWHDFFLKEQQRTRRNKRKTKQRWLGPRLPFSFAFTIFATFAFALSFAAPGVGVCWPLLLWKKGGISGVWML